MSCPYLWPFPAASRALPASQSPSESVVLIVDEDCIFSFTGKGQPPGTIHGNHPVSLQLSLERMPSPPLAVHLRSSRHAKGCRRFGWDVISNDPGEVICHRQGGSTQSRPRLDPAQAASDGSHQKAPGSARECFLYAGVGRRRRAAPMHLVVGPCFQTYQDQRDNGQGHLQAFGALLPARQLPPAPLR